MKKFKKALALLLSLSLVLGMIPASALTAFGADSEPKVVDAAVIFSDLHTSSSNYKESTVKGIFTALKNTGLPFSSVTSAGDAFSVNADSTKYTGKTSTITGYIQDVMGNIPVNYVWSDHDRYAVQADGSTLLSNDSGLIYGAGADGIYGNDDDGNYYIYSLSMADLSTNNRYNADFHTDAEVTAAISEFSASVKKLHKDRPLLIASHQPLFDRRNDNGHAAEWFEAINAAALSMDVAFFFGHNHNYDVESDYYYAKGSTMPVCQKDYSSKNEVLNFTHMCAGYMAPSSTGSTSSTTRQGTAMAITIYDDSINYTTYNSSGVYTGNYALNETVKRTVPATKELSSITVTTPPAKTTYEIGESLDTTGMVITATYSDNSTEDITTKSTVSNVDMTTAGTKTVTVAYKDKTAAFSITVNAEEVTTNTLTDKNTNVTVAAPGLNGLNVNILQDNEVVKKAMTGVLQDGYVAYDITATGYENGNKATVTIPVPTGMDAEKFVVYYISNDGVAIEAMTGKSNGNGTYTFETNHFSTYVGGVPAEASEEGGSTDNVVSGEFVEVQGNSVNTYNVEDVTIYKLVNAPVAGKQYLIVNSNTEAGYGLDGDTSGYAVSTFTGGNNYYTTWDANTSTGAKWEAGSEVFLSTENPYLWTVGSDVTFTHGSTKLGVDRSGFILYNYSLVFNGGDCLTWNYNSSNNSLKVTDYTRYLSCSSRGAWSVESSAGKVYFYEPVTIKKVTTSSTGTPTVKYSIDITVGGTVAETYTVSSVVDVTTLQLGTAFNSEPEGYQPSGGSYKWETTTNNGVASVDEATGLVTFTGTIGTEIVKVSYTWTENGTTYTVYKDIDITTTAPEYTVDITKDGASVTDTLVVKGVADTSNGPKTTQLGSVVTYVDANGKTQSVTPADGTISWKSSDEKVATVDKNGLVTFTPEGGEVEITVEYQVDDNTFKTDTITISAAKENYIIPSDGTNDFPEYPNEGAIRFDKTASAVGNFSQTGIAQVELSMTGVPYTKGNTMDVVIMLDRSNSMTDARLKATRAATKAFIKNVVINKDGSFNGNRIFVGDFQGGNPDYAGQTRHEFRVNTYTTNESNGFQIINSQSELDTIYSLIDSKFVKDTNPPYGTEYAQSLKHCYDLLTKVKPEGNKQFCVFMSDGIPNVYQYGSGANDKLTSSSAMSQMFTGNNYDTRDTDYKYEYYSGLMKENGVTVYTVGLGLNNTNSALGNASATQCLNASSILLNDISGPAGETTKDSGKTLSKKDKYFFSVDDADAATGMTNVFAGIASEILEAATNVVVEDKIADKYTLVLEAPNASVTAALPSGQEFYIEVVSYTLDENHERTSTYTTIEKIYLTDTDKVTMDGNGNIAYIEGDTFTYDAAAHMLIWKADKLTTTELAIRYFVYLDNSAGHVGEDEETAAGTYPTNDYATITYTNFNGNECQQEFPIPQLTWNGAQVSYVFYLVNSDGKPVNRAGQVVDFANATFITKVFTEAVVWNEEEGVTELNATKKAAALLPSTYSLYDKTTEYQIHVYQNENGKDIYNYFVLTAGGGTTKVYNTKAGTKYSSPGTYTASNVFEGFDFANTTVAFAVVWEPKLVEDVVVVDYGLPVDIDVTTNDMFDNSVSGIGRGVEGYGNTLMNTGIKESEVLTATTLDLKYGTASINGKNIRYTPDTMSFTDAETFYYESEVEHYEDSSKKTGYMYSSVTVVPATTIYYEDTTTFVNYTHGYGATDSSPVGTPGKWEIAGTENTYATQDEDRPGVSQISTELDADNIYGYDSAYANCQTYSLGSAHKVNLNAKPSGTSWPKATFTFTGSAFDIISQTSNTTGTIAVDVVNTADDTDTYSWIVDTYYGYTYKANATNPYIKYVFTYGSDAKWHMTSKEEVKTDDLAEGESLEIPAEPEVGATFVTFEENGTWEQTTTDDNTLYQIPVIKSPDLGYGTYTVTITPRFSNGFNHTANDNYDFYLDAIRVYNPAENSTTAEEVYIQDGEAYPEFIELRNQLLGQDAFSSESSVEGAVFIDGFGTSGTISEYESYGPNNEIYLKSGQSVAFKLSNNAYTTIAKEHLGIKAPNGGIANVSVTALNAKATTSTDDSGNEITTYTNISDTLSTTSATELYYDISDCVVWNEDATSKVIVISNTGTDMVSITNLKVTYSGGAAAATSFLMTADDAEAAVSFASARYLASVPVEEPEVSAPEIYEVALNSESVKIGKSVDVTVNTSLDATSVIVNGNDAAQSTVNEEEGIITWTISLKATEAGTMNVDVTAYNESGMASDTVNKTVTVTKSTAQQFAEWLSNLFSFWK